MTEQVAPKAYKGAHSVLVVSENPDFVKNVEEHLFAGSNDMLTVEKQGFHAINGKAQKLAFANDLVIFEALQDDANELDALRELLAKRHDETLFVALTDDSTPLSKVHELREIGVDEVLPLSISDSELNAIIAKTLAQRSARMAPASAPASMGKILAFSQARGGIGATTVAVNMACALAKRPHMFRKGETVRVALLDLDLQFGNANVLLDLEDNGALQSMIENSVIPDLQYLRGMVQHHDSGVDLISAPVSVLPLNAIEEDAIRALIDALQAEYDYIVVDLPRALIDWLEPVIRRASELQIVTDMSVPSLRHAKRLMDFYQQVKLSLPFRIVVNRESKPMMKSTQCRDAEKLLDLSFDHWLPEGAKHARKAADLGQPIAVSAGGSPLGKSIFKLAEATRAELTAQDKNLQGSVK